MADPVQMVVERAERRVGSTLNGKYKLEKLLGMGGMAAVYQASHRNANRVALKIVHPELSVDAEVRHRFLQEGYLANNVEHPGVVRALDDDVSDDGAVFLVMELLEGAPLDDLWEEGQQLPPKEVLNIGYQLLDVLVAAHKRGIVHRDLKPQNLFCTADGTVKVLDFGLARLEQAASPGVTKSGQVFGTPAYMPPEQALGRVAEIDAQSDLWAVGATLFSMLTGKFVHEAQTAAEHLIYTATRRARPIASVASGLPKGICAVVDKSLAFHKAERFPDARSMQHALERAFRSAYGEAIETARPGARARRASPLGLPTFSTTVGGRGSDPTTLLRAPAGARSTRTPWLLGAVGAGVVAGLVLFRVLVVGDADHAHDGVGSPLAEGATSLAAANSPVVSAASPSSPAPTVRPAEPADSASPEDTPLPASDADAAQPKGAPPSVPPGPPPKLLKAPKKPPPPPLSSQNAFEYQ